MRFGLFAICCALLGYGLFRPESPPDLFDDSDKALHVLAFGALALSSRIAFARAPGWALWPLLGLAAPALEWMQHYLQPARQFSSGDILANLLGVALALLGWLLLRRLLATGG